MGAVDMFKHVLVEFHVDDAIVAQIMEDYERIADKDPKEKRAAFFAQAVRRMDALLDVETCHAIRDACACSKGGWRLKAAQKVAKAYKTCSLEEKVHALRQITHMGSPTLNADGTITAGIGGEDGCHCACSVFDSLELSEPVSQTYCYCCAGHFRFHYQIALGKKLMTHSVVSSALESLGKKPCRFVYKIID
jgi:hypothetical protein